jgi:hypothetical protein
MSKIKVDTIQSTQHATSTIGLTSTGATINGDCSATTFTGSGANLTNLPVDLTQLNADNLTSGTVPDAAFPITLPTASGTNLTNLPSANLTGALPALSAANLTSIPAANLTGTLPALSAANLTSIPAANLTGTLPAIDGSALTGVGGGGALEFVSKTTLSSSAAYIDFTGLDDNSIYIFYGKKIKFDASTWTTFAFLDGNGASGNRQVAYIRSATYSSGGGSGSVGTYGNSPETYPNSWPGGSTTLMSFRLEVGTSATNNFFLYKVVAVKDSTTVRMGYGETTGSLATTSSTDRIHGVRFDVNNYGANYDVGTEVSVYKLKES